MERKLRTYEQLTKDELYRVLRLRSGVFVEEQRSPYQDVDGRDPAALHLWYERDGEIAAYARILPPEAPGGECRIGRVAVAAGERGGGLGTAVMREALKAAGERFGATSVRIEAQVQAVPFYERFGFRAVSEPFDDAGVPHVEMLFILEKE